MRNYSQYLLRRILRCVWMLCVMGMVIPLSAQVFKYIDIEDGLSSRRVLSVKKDGTGYMWILTHQGADRYDGSHVTHYTLQKDGEPMKLFPDRNALFTDPERNLWEVGRDGCLFRHDVRKDSFLLEFDLYGRFPQALQQPVTNTYFDSRGRVWFNTRARQYVYDTRSGNVHALSLPVREDVKGMAEDSSRKYFYVATQNHVYGFSLAEDEKPGPLQALPLGEVPLVNYVYYHAHSRKLLVNSLVRGLLLYDVPTGKVSSPAGTVNDIRINTIVPYYKNADEVLIATDGIGVYKLNFASQTISPFLVEDFNASNRMNGNIVKDIYIDSEHRIWNAIYPTGVTVYSEQYPGYAWIKHVPGLENTLSDNRINGILRDSDGDIWFATSNGVSCYQMEARRWTSYLTSPSSTAGGNRIFLSLFEESPGVIVAGGYMSGVYRIRKRTGATEYIFQKEMNDGIKFADKYIRSMIRDEEGTIWVGGSYYLTRYRADGEGGNYSYPSPYPVTALCEKNAHELWMGTSSGLYVFDKRTRRMTAYGNSFRQQVITDVYHPEESPSLTYVATYGNGFFVVDERLRQIRQYRSDNSGLTTDNIFSIVPGRKGYLFLGTGDGITQCDLARAQFVNWGKDQGLMGGSFNQHAGIHAGNGKLIFGGDQGIVIVPDSMRLNNRFESRMILSDLCIMYHVMHPGEKGSPLREMLDDTHELRLNYDQNTFSLKASSINYDNPSDILYTWKLEGFYNRWTPPSPDGNIRYMNLSPGTYTLRVKAVMSNNRHVLDERAIRITISRPPWSAWWALVIYAILVAALLYAVHYYQLVRRKRRTEQEKIDFFVHTAHDIRTPLTLIKAPLGEILKDESLSERGLKNINIAIQNTDNLSRLANNLMDFEKEELYSSHVVVKEYELDTYLRNYLGQFEGYAARKDLTFGYKSHVGTLKVWLDTTKMDSILRNLLTNAIKYTPAGGTVSVEAGRKENEWTLTIADTGIGIPKTEQKHLFKKFFRASNAIHAFLNGSGVGLLLTYRLVKYLEGHISFTSTENEGTCFRLVFPVCGKRYVCRSAAPMVAEASEEAMQPMGDTLPAPTAPGTSTIAGEPLVLIVEDDAPLRNFLVQNLSDMFRTEGAENGAEALQAIKAHQSDLVLSDIVMPVMDGTELCLRLKGNIETSHIPVILLTALGEKNHILNGLEMRADMYIVKPFDLTVLKANICNVLENRELLRNRYRKATIQLPGQGGKEREEAMPDGLDEEFLKRVADYVKEGLGSDMTIDTLCSAMKMGRTSFYNKIKALTGMAPADFVRNIRMQEAALLLRSRCYTVGEVADRMGFADPKYFTDTFKKFFGVTPSAYMKQQGGTGNANRDAKDGSFEK